LRRSREPRPARGPADRGPRARGRRRLRGAVHRRRLLRARRTAGPRAHLLQHAPPSPARGRALARPGARAIPRAAERLREEPPRARQRAPGTRVRPRAPPPPPPEPAGRGEPARHPSPRALTAFVPAASGEKSGTGPSALTPGRRSVVGTQRHEEGPADAGAARRPERPPARARRPAAG